MHGIMIEQAEEVSQNPHWTRARLPDRLLDTASMLVLIASVNVNAAWIWLYRQHESGAPASNLALGIRLLVELEQRKLVDAPIKLAHRDPAEFRARMGLISWIERMPREQTASWRTPPWNFQDASWQTFWKWATERCQPHVAR